MKIGIVGLGLIGGSMAKAYRAYSEENHSKYEIYGFDIDRSIVDFATLDGTLDAPLDNATLPLSDLIFIALYPEASIEYIEKNAHKFKKDAVVIDLCGTKGQICRIGFESAKAHGYTFIGGHPMAGTHRSGYKYSKATLFRGAPMVIVPPTFDDIELLSHVKDLLAPAMFAKFSYTTAQEHDRMIAFTSQLAHIVSNAYIKSPTAKSHKGFSAGSYKDMTRVAWLNEHMWSELFLENKQPLLFEIDGLIAALSQYRDAIENDDKQELTALLRDGRIAKENTERS